MRKVLIFIAIGCFVLAFLSWRMDFNTPLAPSGTYIGIGAFMSMLLLFGRFIAKFMMIAAAVFFGFTILNVLFNKNLEWSDVWGGLVLGVICLIAAAITHFVGSEAVEWQIEDDIARTQSARGTAIVCAQCDQYLGNSLDFEMPCPRCGSNRYTTDS